MSPQDPQHLQWAQQIGRNSLTYASARVLQVAVKVGLFAEISRSPGLSTDALTEALSLDRTLLEKVLIACCAMDWLQRRGAGWALSEPAAVALDPASPLYQGNIILHTCSIWQSWNDLEDRLRGRSGASVFTDGAEREHDHRAFILGMRDLAVAGRADEVVKRIDLGNCHLMIDVGGGPATYSIAFCRRHPQLRVELFDLPQTLAIAAPLIEQAGYADRITLIEGDWNDDPFGADADAVFMSQVLHGPADRTEEKLAKAHAALRPGGRLIVQDFLLNDDKTGPVWPALFNIMVGAWAQGELLERITAAGFDVDTTETLPDYIDATLITATRR